MFVLQMQLRNKCLYCTAKPLWLNAMNDHSQIRILPTLNNDPIIAILNFIQVGARAAPAK